MAGGIKGKYSKSGVKVSAKSGKIGNRKNPSKASNRRPSSTKINTNTASHNLKDYSKQYGSRNKVKRLNERFRKIYTDPRYANSQYYKELVNRLNSHPNSARSKAYKVERDSKGNITKVRLLNATEYAQADSAVRAAFHQELKRGLEAKTTTLRGMKKAMTSAAASLKQNKTFAENLQDVSTDQINAAWKMYTDVQNWLKSQNGDFDDTRGYDLMVNYLAQYKGVAEDTNFDELFDRLAGSSNKLREEFDNFNRLERSRKRNEKRNKESNRRRG